jgi:hypothetical protein
MGVLLYGVYLFISSGIQENGKTFIGGQKTFLLEAEDWIEKAELAIEKVKDANDINKLFRKSYSKTNYKGGATI